MLFALTGGAVIFWSAPDSGHRIDNRPKGHEDKFTGKPIDENLFRADIQ